MHRPLRRRHFPYAHLPGRCATCGRPCNDWRCARCVAADAPPPRPTDERRRPEGATEKPCTENRDRADPACPRAKAGASTRCAGTDCYSERLPGSRWCGPCGWAVSNERDRRRRRRAAGLCIRCTAPCPGGLCRKCRTDMIEEAERRGAAARETEMR